MYIVRHFIETMHMMPYAVLAAARRGAAEEKLLNEKSHKTFSFRPEIKVVVSMLLVMQVSDLCSKNSRDSS